MDTNESEQSTPYVCATCKRGDVRLYRIYGNFLRRAELGCNAHLPCEAAWAVPLIVAADNSVWGYTSSPAADINRWQAQPDADPSGPVWAGSRWSTPHA